MTPAEHARLVAIEKAAREYVEWGNTPAGLDTMSSRRWLDRAADLRRRLADALEKQA